MTSFRDQSYITLRHLPKTLEGRGGCLVERLDGCFSNVIGLSLPLVSQWMRAGG